MVDMLRNGQARINKIATPTSIRDKDTIFWFACKRIMDVVLASSILLLLSPVMLVIALLIRLDSRGSSIFVHERVGSRPRFKDGRMTWEMKKFRFYKFRSMAQNADQSLHQAHIQAFINGTLDTSKGTVKMTNDPRVTRIGAILRKTSLDELPQLFNVLKGDMSLVGPRPVPAYEVEGYQPWHYERLNAMPGITGLWQVKGRGTVAFDDMMHLDIEYVRTRSLWMDIKLLFLTVSAVFSCRGAK